MYTAKTQLVQQVCVNRKVIKNEIGVGADGLEKIN